MGCPQNNYTNSFGNSFIIIIVIIIIVIIIIIYQKHKCKRKYVIRLWAADTL